MIPEKWTPASRLREARGNACRVARCLGGRRQIGKDHAPVKKLERDENSKKVIPL
jgi:hypothetical protein